MIQAGITGNIGSGKSTVCKLFQQFDVPVYLADDRAKALMADNPDVMQQVQEAFGQDIYENSVLQRKKLASIVFKNPDKLNTLNNIVHPAVKQDYEAWIREQDAPLTLKEAALLFESGSYKMLYCIITVTAPEEVRIQRIIERDATTREEVQSRMKNQWPEADKVAKSDYTLNNDGEHLLIPQVTELYDVLTNKAKNDQKQA